MDFAGNIDFLTPNAIAGTSKSCLLLQFQEKNPFKIRKSTQASVFGELLEQYHTLSPRH